MSKITKGNIDEVKAASNERIELVLLRKDFSKESFVRINLSDATISKCIFIGTKFFANEYTNSDFISCDFTKADFLNVKFSGCKFHECKFNEATLQEVNFENCSMMTCSFENTKIENDVVGLDEKDMNIIHEESKIDEEKLNQIGFTKEEEGSFSISDSINNGPRVSLIIVEDPEIGNNIFRVMLMVDNDSILSDTFETEPAVDFEEVSRIAKSILFSGKNKVTPEFFDGDEQKYDLFIKAWNEVKNKFKQYFNEK